MTTAPKIGVVGAPDIAHALSTLGFDVITADSFREAATAISNALKDAPFRVIVADSTEPVIVPWTTVTLSKAEHLVVIATEPGQQLLAASHPHLRLSVPATFNDLLGKLGYASTPAPVGSKVIGPDGALVDEAPAPAALPTPVALPTPAAPVQPDEVAAEATVASPEPVFVTPSADVVESEESPSGFVVGDPGVGKGAEPAAPVFTVPDAPANVAESTPVPAPTFSPVFDAAPAPETAPAFAAPAVPTPAPVFTIPAAATDAAPQPASVPPQAEVLPPAFESPQPMVDLAPAPVFAIPSTQPETVPAAAPTFEVPVAPAFQVPAAAEAAPAPAATFEAPALPSFQVPAEDPLGVSDAAVDAIFGTPSAPATQTPRPGSDQAPEAPYVEPAPAAEPVPAYSAPLPRSAPVQTGGRSVEQQPVDDYFQSRVAVREAAGQPVAQPRPRVGGKHGEVIISGAAKGGVGKTSTAIFLADVAARMGLQAILIDANRGQADIRKYLRLGDAKLPSAYDAYESGDPARAILMPKDYAHLRTAAKLDVPDFGIVLGPPSDLADPRWVSAGIYGDIIDYARSIADVVIVDTQIVEAHRTDLWNNVFIPLLGGDAWFVAISDESAPGISNLAERLTEMRRAGVNPARTLVMGSQFFSFGPDEIAFFQSKFGDLGTLVGSTGIDDEFHMQLNNGLILADSPAIRPAIDSILLRATARQDLFAPQQPEQPAKNKSGGGVFGLFGKKKR